MADGYKYLLCGQEYTVVHAIQLISASCRSSSITTSLKDADISPVALYIPFEVKEIKVALQIIQERTDKG